MTPRAVELVRVSGHDQHERDTARAQRDALDALRERRPANVIARIDPPGAVSASLPVAQRPDLTELRRLAESGGFDELRCFDLTRLSRAENPVDRMMVLSIVASAGAIIVDCSGRELDPMRDEDELSFYIGTLFGRTERRKFVARSAAGKHTKAAQGQIIARLGFGYRPLPRVSKKEPPSYEADPHTAPLVVEIFTRTIAGEGQKTIAKWLEAQGVSAPRGGRRWSASHVHRIVHSETYCGTFRQSVEGVEYKVDCPALVTRETWDAAQAAIASRFMVRGRPGSVQALCRMRAWCSLCSARVVVHTQSKGRGYGARYVCSKRCGLPSQPVAEVDELVWLEIRSIIEHPDLLLEAADDPRDPGTEWEEQIAQCEKTIAKTVKDERKVLGLLRRDLLSDEAAADELRRIRTARTTAERSIETARHALAQAARRTGITEDAVEMFRGLLGGATTFDERRRILEAVIPEARETGVFFHDDGTFEVVGQFDLTASEGAGGVGGRVASACSKVRPAESLPRVTRAPTWVARWCAPQRGRRLSGAAVGLPGDVVEVGEGGVAAAGDGAGPPCRRITVRRVLGGTAQASIAFDHSPLHVRIPAMEAPRAATHVGPLPARGIAAGLRPIDTAVR